MHVFFSEESQIIFRIDIWINCVYYSKGTSLGKWFDVQFFALYTATLELKMQFFKIIQVTEKSLEYRGKGMCCRMYKKYGTNNSRLRRGGRWGEMKKRIQRAEEGQEFTMWLAMWKKKNIYIYPSIQILLRKKVSLREVRQLVSYKSVNPSNWL